MTREEARLILDAHTLNGVEESDDAALREAQQMMREDATLQAWFEKRRAFDENIALSMDDVPLPAGLKERLLQSADAHVSRRSGMLKVWVALATVVVIAGVIFMSMPRSHDDEWMKQSLAQIARIETDPSYDLDAYTHDMSVVTALLTKSGAPMPGGLPKNLAPGMTVGCKVFQIDGHKATVVCFEVEPGVEAHLAVVESGVDLSKLPSSSPLFADRGEWHTARWTGDGKAYLLATRGKAEMLRKLFA